MNSYFALRSKNILTPSGMLDGYVLIRDRKIEDVFTDQMIPSGLVVDDVGTNVVMPGMIDSHVHINEPGRTDWEGFESATKSAAAGGITTLVDMPLNSSPVTTTVAAFQQKLEASKGKLFVNCGFYGGIIPGNAADIGPLIKAGVLGFKAFLTHSGIDEFPNAGLADLEMAAPLLSSHNIPLLAHAELDSEHEGLTAFEKNPTSYVAFLNSRPKVWEDEAIAMLIRLSEKYRLRVHVVHLSSANSIGPLKTARDKGLQVTVETCPHYLFFSEENIPDHDTRFKCTPPIREKENNEQLFSALKDGLIDFIVSDHSPAPPELKKVQSGNLKEAWGGISSLQFSVPIVWTILKKNNLSLEMLSQRMSSHVAQFLGLATSKGKIQKGYDADLVVFNPEKKFIVSSSMIHHRHKLTPYDGCELTGVVEQTYVGGTKVFDRGSFVSSPCGKIILRQA